jgi:hypothetical protein
VGGGQAAGAGAAAAAAKPQDPDQARILLRQRISMLQAELDALDHMPADAGPADGIEDAQVIDEVPPPSRGD